MQTTGAAQPGPTTDAEITTSVPTTVGPGQRLYSAAAIIELAFVISRALGLARNIIGQQFGTGEVYDAYVAAFSIPRFLFMVVMSGAFGSAFVPVFAGFLGQGEVRKAWRLASNVLTIMVEAFVVVALLAFFLTDPLVRHFLMPGRSPTSMPTTPASACSPPASCWSPRRWGRSWWRGSCGRCGHKGRCVGCSASRPASRRKPGTTCSTAAGAIWSC